MPHNSLYNVVTSEFYQKNKALPGTITLKQNTYDNGKHSYFFSLPVNGRINLNGYTLTEHHVSISTSAITKIDLISEYHYTAFFVDKDNRQYRLHVYFDTNDYIVRTPYLNKCLEHGYEFIDSSEFAASFALLAQVNSKELIQTLRDVQEALILDLRAKSEALDQKLETLSVHLLANKTAYLELLNQQIAVLTHLKDYARQPRSIQKQIDYYINLSNAVDLLAPPAKITEAKTEKTEKVLQRATPKKNAPQKVKKRSIDLTALRNEHALLSKESIMSASYLNDLYDQIQEKEFTINFKLVTATIYDIKFLKNFSTIIQHQGKTLLSNSLMRKEFDKAKELCRFNSHLSIDFLFLALKLRNSELLRFLFENNVFSAHVHPVTIDKKTYTSLVDYCFKNDTKDRPYLDVLVILVTHGASLMEIDDSTGLPFAANLLLDHAHPLYEVLKKSGCLTRLFYKQMNQVLAFIGSKSDVSLAIKEKIERLLANNDKTLHDFIFVKQFSNQEYIDKGIELSDVTSEVLGAELSDRVSKDPEIKWFKARLERRVRQFLTKLPRLQQLKHEKQLISSMNELIDVKGEFNSADTDRDFDRLKSNILATIMICLRVYDSKEELMDIEKELATLNGLQAKKLTKRQKELVSRKNELNQQLISDGKELEKSSAPDIKKQMQEVREINALNDARNTVLNAVTQMEKTAKLLEDLRSSINNVSTALNRNAFMPAPENSANLEGLELPSEQEFDALFNDLDASGCKPQ